MKQEAAAPVSPAWVEVADCEESRASTIQLVQQLLERLNDQSEQLSLQEERLALQDELIQQLKDEIARLKGEQGRPQKSQAPWRSKAGQGLMPAALRGMTRQAEGNALVRRNARRPKS